jgi:tetratricopeptide (TPR) repeat protein
MASPNLDETSPTYAASGDDEDASQAASADQGTNVTQPTLSPPEGGETAMQSLEETQPSHADEEGSDLSTEIPPETPRHSGRWILWSILAVLLLVLIAGGSAYAGYNSAVNERIKNQAAQMASVAANQYVLAQQDIALGSYDRARQRLEYVIQIDPNYPGAADQLASVLTLMRITATPTQAPTPTLTPTPDYRGRDDLFTQGQTMLAAMDWNGTIDTLLLLRKNYPDYMAVKVDDMLFVALRNRGIDKIAQQHDLEGGNYDLTLAERFGPLDAEANNWREWADLYIRGASYWDVDWGQAVYYFSQLADAVPNLSDASGWTASNRYMDALLGYGDWYANQGLWCEAQAQYDTYMSMLADPKVEPTAVYASDKCVEASAVPPTKAAETPTPPAETPTQPAETPTQPADTPTATQEPSSTPYP